MPKISEKYRSKQLTPEFIEQASKGGIKFESFLVPSLAKWVVGLVAEGYFASPDEAVFHMMQEMQDLSKFPDLRRKILSRVIDKSIKNFEPSGVNSENMDEWFESLDKNRVKPVTWTKDPSVWDSYCDDNGFNEDGTDIIDYVNNEEQNLVVLDEAIFDIKEIMKTGSQEAKDKIKLFLEEMKNVEKV